MMAEIVDTWKEKTEKQIQHDIGEIWKRINSMELHEIKPLVKQLLTICHNANVMVNVKLRFGQILVYAAEKYDFPFSINSITENYEASVLLVYLNGLLDSRKSQNRFQLSTKILFKIIDTGKNLYQYHIGFLTKKWWNEFDKEVTDDNLEFSTLDQIIRYFLPYTNSTVSGLSGLVDKFFTSVIKWSLNNRNLIISDKLIELFGEIFFRKFYPECLTEGNYPLIKISLKYLKIIISAFEIRVVLEKLPYLIEYLFQVVTLSHTAPVIKDIFIAITKQQHLPYSFIIQLKDVVRQFVIDNFKDKDWFDEASCDMQKFKFMEYILPYLVKLIPVYLKEILDELTEKINKESIRDYHYLYLWISLMAALNVNINGNKMLLKQCLWNDKDPIRILAYKFICDNFFEFSANNSISFCDLLTWICHSLTNDNPGFRNNFLNQTKRLLAQIRDTVMLDFINERKPDDNDDEFIETLLDISDMSIDTSLMHLEFMNWELIEKSLIKNGVVRVELGILLIFARTLINKQWIYSCSNYQRQKTVAELINIIYDVLLAEQDIFMDKMCGFNCKTKILFKSGLSKLIHKFMFPSSESVISVCQVFLGSIYHARLDAQTKIYNVFRRLLNLESIKLKFQQSKLISNDLSNLNGTFSFPSVSIITEMCHSTKPNIWNVGAHLILLDIELNKHDSYWLNVFNEYLKCTQNLKDHEIAQYSKSRPGHGILTGIENWLLDTKLLVDITASQVGLIIKSCVGCIDVMLHTMGSHCDDDDEKVEEELVSFQQMGVSLQSLATNSNNSRARTVKLTGIYQHLLSWAWQTLKSCVGLCVAGYYRLRSMDTQNVKFENETGELVALTIIKIMTKSRHRGTIETVAKYLKTHLSNLSTSTCKIDSRHVAMDICLGNAIFGKYSVTRRSAGLPLMLIAALTSTKTEVDPVLISDVIDRLVTIAQNFSDNQFSHSQSQVLTDSTNIHALNLLKRVVTEPSLATCPTVTKRLGDLIVLTLSGFTTCVSWRVRNAALQLFVTTASRLACVNQGVQSNASVLEVFGVYPELIKPFATILVENHCSSSVLVPALTFLLHLVYSPPELLPCQYSLFLLPAVYRLLNSQFCSVRRLSVKCVLNLNPEILSEYDFPKITDQYNLQHSKLLFSQVASSGLTQQIVLSYISNLYTRKLWYMLEQAIPLLKYVEVDSETLNTITSISASQMENKIGYSNYCIALLDLYTYKNIPISPAVISNILINPKMEHILQEIIMDKKYLMQPLFADNLDLVIKHTVRYANSCSFRHLINVLARLVEEANPDYNDFNDLHLVLEENLKLTKSDSIISNLVVVMTWVCLKMTSASIDVLMTYILKGLDADKPVNTRLVSLWSLSRMMQSNYQQEMRKKFWLEIVTAVVLGTLDEDYDVRCGFRSVLFEDYTEKTISIISTYVYRNFLVSNHICLAVWKNGLLKKIEAQLNDVLKSSISSDVLYEPSLSNIYLEIGFLLDVVKENLYHIGNLETKEFQSQLEDLIEKNQVLLNDTNISKLSSAEPSLVLAKTSLLLLNQFRCVPIFD